MNRDGAPAPAAGAAPLRAAVAFLVMAATAAVVAAITSGSLGLGLSVADVLRLAGFYLAAFHGSSVELDAEPLPGSEVQVVVSGALLLGLVLAGILLWWAGTRAGARTSGGAAGRFFAGARVGLLYGGGCAAVALLNWGSSLAVGRASVSILAPSAVVRPLVFGVTVAGVAAVATGMEPGPQRDRLAGAWRMVSWCLLGSFVAMLVVAGLDPSYSRVYFAGIRSARTQHGAAEAVHNLLLLPNEAAWASTAAMGGCIGVRGDLDADLVCRGRVASGIAGEDLVQAPLDPEAAVPEGSEPFPIVLLVFVVATPVAVVAGGYRAAGEALRPGVGARRGAAAGLVFGPAFALAAWLSGFALRSSAAALGDLAVRAGPIVWSALLLAWAWGIAGGAAGGAMRVGVDRWRDRARTASGA